MAVTDETEFAAIAQQYFRELHVHCYRMVGSFDDAEDLVQETMLRAWRSRESYEGRGGASIRAWLYRIATNVCIDELRKRPERSGSTDEPGEASVSRVPWVQPYPDAFLDAPAGEATQPDQQVVAGESMEMGFLTAIQLLPAKQRAALILRDLLEFSASETAEMLDDTTAAVNSALQRARASLRERRPSGPKNEFGELVFRKFVDLYVDLQARGDIDGIVRLLRDDIRMTLLPAGLVWEGAKAVECEMRKQAEDFGDVRNIPIAANRQPAMAVYRRVPGSPEFRPWGIVLLGVVNGKLREIATFASPNLFPRFNLPASLQDR